MIHPILASGFTSLSVTYCIEQESITHHFLDLAAAVDAFNDRTLDLGELATLNLGNNHLLDGSFGIELGAVAPNLGVGFDFVLGNPMLTARQPVPLPGSGWLFGTGIWGLLVAARCKTAKREA